jgi:hypothetical protein
MKKIHTPITFSCTKEKDDERLEVLHQLSLLIWQCPVEREIPQFLQWLEELPSGETALEAICSMLLCLLLLW